jgi:hypothetical protein
MLYYIEGLSKNNNDHNAGSKIFTEKMRLPFKLFYSCVSDSGVPMTHHQKVIIPQVYSAILISFLPG